MLGVVAAMAATAVAAGSLLGSLLDVASMVDYLMVTLSALGCSLVSGEFLVIEFVMWRERNLVIKATAVEVIIFVVVATCK